MSQDLQQQAGFNQLIYQFCFCVGTLVSSKNQTNINKRACYMMKVTRTKHQWKPYCLITFTWLYQDLSHETRLNQLQRVCLNEPLRFSASCDVSSENRPSIQTDVLKWASASKSTSPIHFCKHCKPYVLLLPARAKTRRLMLSWHLRNYFYF